MRQHAELLNTRRLRQSALGQPRPRRDTTALVERRAARRARVVQRGPATTRPSSRQRHRRAEARRRVVSVRARRAAAADRRQSQLGQRHPRVRRAPRRARSTTRRSTVPELRIDLRGARRAAGGGATRARRTCSRSRRSRTSPACKHPLELVARAHDRGWDVLLDAAAFVPTNRLDLQRGAARLRQRLVLQDVRLPDRRRLPAGRATPRSAKLRRPWFAGGTVNFATVGGRAPHPVAGRSRLRGRHAELPLDSPPSRSACGIWRRSASTRSRRACDCLTGWLLERARRAAALERPADGAHLRAADDDDARRDRDDELLRSRRAPARLPARRGAGRAAGHLAADRVLLQSRARARRPKGSPTRTWPRRSTRDPDLTLPRFLQIITHARRQERRRDPRVVRHRQQLRRRAALRRVRREPARSDASDDGRGDVRHRVVPRDSRRQLTLTTPWTKWRPKLFEALASYDRRTFAADLVAGPPWASWRCRWPWRSALRPASRRRPASTPRSSAASWSRCWAARSIQISGPTGAFVVIVAGIIAAARPVRPADGHDDGRRDPAVPGADGPWAGGASSFRGRSSSASPTASRC